MRKAMRLFYAVFFLLLGFLLALPAVAQNPVEPPRVTISGEYTLLRTNIGAAGGGNASVLMVSPAFRVTKGESTLGFALSGRFDYLRGNAPHFQSFLYGIEARRKLSDFLPSSDYFKAEKFEFFGNASAGFSRFPRPDKPAGYDNDFTWSYGGGVDFTDTHADLGPAKITIRAFEFKIVRGKGYGGGLKLENNFLAATGLTLRF